MSVAKYAAFGRAVGRCDSFIERRFAVALLFSEAFSFEPSPTTANGTIAIDAHGVVLGQQVKVGGCLIDFALKRQGADARIAIELDGFRYHDATPEQAERDRRRDRMLVGLGWRVIRFVSRELTQDALGCAMQAHRLIMSLSASPPTTTTVLAKTSPVRVPGQLLLGEGKVA